MRCKNFPGKNLQHKWNTPPPPMAKNGLTADAKTKGAIHNYMGGRRGKVSGGSRSMSNTGPQQLAIGLRADPNTVSLGRLNSE